MTSRTRCIRPTHVCINTSGTDESCMLELEIRIPPPPLTIRRGQSPLCNQWTAPSVRRRSFGGVVDEVGLHRDGVLSFSGSSNSAGCTIISSQPRLCVECCNFSENG
uniref:Uncharacterized protein n=1 Tax=Physcomitrium patens TaxID=3218 RepID=A0A2K1JTK0_PHYPA|nr:hypothetical protein PHYPA_014629 [Physcomitrium patens]